MDVPKRLVAEAGSLLFWAERNVGEALGEAPKPGKDVGRGRELASPDGETIARMEKVRYRKLAQIDEEAALKLRMEATPNLAQHGEIGRGRAKERGTTSTSIRGESPDYLAARLKRDRV